MAVQIFGAVLSPYVRKVCVAAAEKGVAFDLVRTSIAGAPNPAFTAASPFRKMPAMSDGDFTLADSSAIVHYLDAQYPGPALIPADPRARGRAVWFDEFADTLMGASGLKVLFNRLVAPRFLGMPGDEAIAAQGEAELPAHYAYLEAQLATAPADGWLVGADFTIADIAVAAMIRTLAYVAVEPTPDAYPVTMAWYARVCARPAWQQVVALEPVPKPT